MRGRKGKWRKAGPRDVGGDLAVIEGLFQGLSRGLAEVWGLRRMTKSKRQYDEHRQWDRAKPLKEKGGSEGAGNLLVGKLKNNNNKKC